MTAKKFIESRTQVSCDAYASWQKGGVAGFLCVVANGQAYVKSEAVLRIASELPRWQWTWLFHFIPRVIRDEIYDLVARNRYRWFGRRDACILPNSDRSWW